MNQNRLRKKIDESKVDRKFRVVNDVELLRSHIPWLSQHIILEELVATFADFFHEKIFNIRVSLECPVSIDSSNAD